ncbi:MAG: heparinase II/III family protein [Clostridia bacterium]|nr:heparinase II/III family protein [Clostridia bacterium]
MFDKFKDPKFIEEYRTSPKYEELRSKYLEYYNIKNKPLSILEFSKIRKFSEIGERSSYEVDHSDHIRKLIACAYMALFYGEDYIRDLDDCIYDVLSIYCWALPAHVPDITEENYYELDLCSTAMGTTLALIYHLMGDKIHPLNKKRIKTELERRILEPFKRQIWHWEDRYNNWTSVCAGFTGITLMLVFPDEFDKLLPRFELNMKKYYQGFPDDGVCLEGPGYWGYGFVSFLAYAIALRDYTKGEIDYFKLEKTKKIALFYQNTMLDEDVITSYGDSPMDVKTNAALLYILKSVYGDEFIMPSKSRHSLPDDPFIHILLYIEYYDPSYEFTPLPREEVYMENAGWFIKRTDKYCLGAKGGTNGESHNHNDVGSFIISKNNKQVLIDIGVRPYTKDYFTDVRYTKYLEPASRSHNVPIINGKEQANIRGTKSYTSYKNGVFSVDYHELYDIEGLYLVRDYTPNESGVTVRDTFKGVNTLVERLVSYDEPKIEDGAITIDSVKVLFDKSLAKASYKADIHTVSINEDNSLKEGKTVYLIDIEVNEPCDHFEFRIEA